LKIDSLVPEAPMDAFTGLMLPPVDDQVTLAPLSGCPKNETDRSMVADSFAKKTGLVGKILEREMTRGFGASVSVVWAEVIPWVEAVRTLCPEPTALRVVNA
jgi:hypothetical protein